MTRVTSILCYLLFLNCVTQIVSQDSEIFFLTVPQIISKYGYPQQEHFVTTSDGYILRLHRIPSTSGKPVLVVHGLLCSSYDWIMSGPSKAIAYTLSDAGYDVWLGNCRGNSQSRNHTTLNPDKDPSFWNFSFHEMGVFDLPAMVDYILTTTKQKQLVYIGHSQGGIIINVLLSELPEYNAKIKSFHLLSPGVYLNHNISVLFRLLLSLSDLLERFKFILEINEILPNNKITAEALRDFCAVDSITQPICQAVYLITFGYTPKEFNATLVPIVVGHTPAGSSLKQLVHLQQLVVSGKFRQYNYGLDNIRKYKSPTPPFYNLSKITAKAHLFYSNSDFLVVDIDAKRTCKDLGSACKGEYLITDFSHADFMYGIDAKEVLYKKILDVMSRS